VRVREYFLRVVFSLGLLSFVFSILTPWVVKWRPSIVPWHFVGEEYYITGLFRWHFILIMEVIDLGILGLDERSLFYGIFGLPETCITMDSHLNVFAYSSFSF